MKTGVINRLCRGRGRRLQQSVQEFFYRLYNEVQTKKIVKRNFVDPQRFLKQSNIKEWADENELGYKEEKETFTIAWSGPKNKLGDNKRNNKTPVSIEYTKGGGAATT